MPIPKLHPFELLIFMNPVESIGIRMIEWLDVLAYDRKVAENWFGSITYLPPNFEKVSPVIKEARGKVRMWSQALFNCQDTQEFIAKSKQMKIRFPTDELERAGYRVEFTRFGHERVDVSIHHTRTNEMLTCDTVFTGFYARKSGNAND